MTPKKADKDQFIVMGKNIERLLYQHRINQSDLAKILDVSDSAVGKWILGKNGPSMGNVQKMADYFNVSMSSIFEEQPNNPISSQKQFLMNKIAKADDRKLDKIRKLMELIDDEEVNND